MRQCLATGNWGCGAFKNNFTLKCLQQWLIASLFHIPLKYHLFGIKDIDIDTLYRYQAEGHTVRDLFNAIMDDQLTDQFNFFKIPKKTISDRTQKKSDDINFDADFDIEDTDRISDESHQSLRTSDKEEQSDMSNAATNTSASIHSSDNAPNTSENMDTESDEPIKARSNSSHNVINTSESIDTEEPDAAVRKNSSGNTTKVIIGAKGKKNNKKDRKALVGAKGKKKNKKGSKAVGSGSDDPIKGEQQKKTTLL